MQPQQSNIPAQSHKFFIGGIPTTTSYNELYNHFNQYGEILDQVIIKDKQTRKPRGFGFVTFNDERTFNIVLNNIHVINGKEIELKPAFSREQNKSVNKAKASSVRLISPINITGQRNLFLKSEFQKKMI